MAAGLFFGASSGASASGLVQPTGTQQGAALAAQAPATGTQGMGTGVENKSQMPGRGMSQGAGMSQAMTVSQQMTPASGIRTAERA